MEEHDWEIVSDDYVEGSGDSDDEDDLVDEVASVVCVGACLFLMTLMDEEGLFIERDSYQNHYLTDRNFVKYVVESNEHCHNLLRMNVECFRRFVNIFKESDTLKDTVHYSFDEQVAIFLHTVAHNLRNRCVKVYCRRSGETISRYFNKDCIGAIDGTHIPAKLPAEIKKRYIGRKGHPTQNVLAACDFDMKFTFVVAGWEGSASDSRILGDAIVDDFGITRHSGKFYLADAGFPLLNNFITLYHVTRYHLSEQRGRTPRTKKELFNYRHSSARNVIERMMPNDAYIAEVDRKLAEVEARRARRRHREAPDEDDSEAEESESAPRLGRIADAREGNRIREQILQGFMCFFEGMETSADDGKEKYVADEGKGKNVSWTSEMDLVLLQALRHEAIEGGKIPNGFKKSAYKYALLQINQACGIDLTFEQVKPC
ncbi:uncharacterized protein LOC143885956 [Tasmannia lanceolata]|uniref:uncharacterized protein LOC143885956 n=1 Tax=Tasmannia lanceolata TaxID=3420 RepID=UPI004063E6EE